MDLLKYKELNENKWESFLCEAPSCPLNYGSDWIAFEEEYICDRLVSNESFLVLQNKIVVAIAVIFIEKADGMNKQISWDGSYCTAPYINPSLSFSAQKKILKQVMMYIDQLAQENRCTGIGLKFDPLNNPQMTQAIYNYNWLIQYGYLDQSSLTQIINLKKDIKQLSTEMRKGTKSAIKHGSAVYEFELYDHKNITNESIEICRQIYQADAGKITRTSELLNHYQKMIENNHGILGFAKRNNHYIAAIICSLREKTGYYLLYAELTPETGGISPGHFLQLKMIEELQKRGVEFYEIGEQVFGKTYYSDPSEKLINISLFKRGFGGYTIPYYRGWKIFNTEICAGRTHHV